MVETLRQLVFIADSWASRTIRDERMPFHRLGIPQTAYAPADAAALGMDLDARPSFADALEVGDGRMALVRGIVDDLTDISSNGCARVRLRPGYPEGSRSVGECLEVVMKEDCEHHRYAARDLAVLESR